MFIYNVCCKFTSPDKTVVDEWLAWLKDRHLADVCRGGATSAQVVKLDDTLPSYEIRYRFPNRESFEIYERDHAPGLRAEGLSLFPPERGIEYQRSTGEVVLDHPRD